MRCQFTEKLFNSFSPFTGLLLDATHELINITPVDLEIIVGELAPLLFDLATKGIPLAL
ncbi:MAG: hypothetical protein NVSMB9_29810 [Isosphaeraceae bacterium]